MELDRLETRLNVSGRWVIYLVFLLLFVYIGSLIWGYIGIHTGRESLFLLLAVASVGGFSVNTFQPEKKWRNVFILFALVAVLSVYFTGRWINYWHFEVLQKDIVEVGAFRQSQSLLSEFTIEKFMKFYRESERFFVLTDIAWLVSTLYVVQFVTKRKSNGKHEDHNFHTDRKSRFQRKFNR